MTYHIRLSDCWLFFFKMAASRILFGYNAFYLIYRTYNNYKADFRDFNFLNIDPIASLKWS